jgi:hypothetical protein
MPPKKGEHHYFGAGAEHSREILDHPCVCRLFRRNPKISTNYEIIVLRFTAAAKASTNTIYTDAGFNFVVNDLASSCQTNSNLIRTVQLNRGRVACCCSDS